jgi:hypothetical protein
MDAVRPSDRLGGGLGDPEVENLSLLDHLTHRPPGLLDRDRRIDAVLVVEIDVVDPEPLKRGVATQPDVFRSSVHPDPTAVRAALVPELRRQDDLVAMAFDRATDEHLVGERAVHVGGVQEVHPDLESPVDRRDRFRIVGGAIGLAHPHATESDRGHLESASEVAGLHGFLQIARSDGRFRR